MRVGKYLGLLYKGKECHACIIIAGANMGSPIIGVIDFVGNITLDLHVLSPYFTLLSNLALLGEVFEILGAPALIPI